MPYWLSLTDNPKCNANETTYDNLISAISKIKPPFDGAKEMESHFDASDFSMESDVIWHTKVMKRRLAVFVCRSYINNTHTNG